MSAFRVGQKVVCINDVFMGTIATGRKLPSSTWGIKTPILGQVCTVRSVGDYDGVIGLRFYEMVNDHVMSTSGAEVTFRADKFRPVHTLESDIAIFKAIPIPTELEPS